MAYYMNKVQYIGAEFDAIESENSKLPLRVFFASNKLTHFKVSSNELLFACFLSLCLSKCLALCLQYHQHWDCENMMVQKQYENFLLIIKDIDVEGYLIKFKND